MASYELPQIRVFQELDPTVTPVRRAMLPVIIGELKDLIRYSNKDEKELGYLGSYDRDAITWEYPTLGGNSDVITNTVRVYADDVYAAVNKAPFVDDVQALSPLHSSFDPGRYFTKINAKQTNLVIFTSANEGGLNLNGSDFFRAPVIGDYVRVRQESQDTVGQFADWTAQVTDLVYTLAPRTNEGVGTPEADEANALKATTEVDTVATDTAIPGDGEYLNVEYCAASLTKIAKINTARFGGYAELVMDSACDSGLFNLEDLGYSFRITNVDTVTKEFSYSITSRKGVKTGRHDIEAFVQEKDTTSKFVWLNSDQTVLVGHPGKALGGIIVDNMFVIYAVAVEETPGIPTKNDTVELTGTIPPPISKYNGTTNSPAFSEDLQFDSTEDTIYTIEVIRGGAKDFLHSDNEYFVPNVQFRVTSNTDLDPVKIVSAVIASDKSVTVPVGTKGVKVKFKPTMTTGDTPVASHIAFARGDRWSIECTGLSKEDLVGVMTDKNFPHYGTDVDITPSIGAGYSCTGALDSTIFRFSTPVFSDLGFEVGQHVRLSISGVTGEDYEGFNGTFYAKVATGDTVTFSNPGVSGGVKCLEGGETNFGPDLCVTIGVAQRLDVELLTHVKSLNVPKLQLTGLDNWSLTENGVTTHGGMKVFVPEVGAELYLSSAELYTEYEALNKEHVGEVLTVVSASDARLGINDPLNPIGYGATKALLNSGGAPILVLCVEDFGESLEFCLDRLSNNNSAYQLAAMTYDVDAQDTITAHCEAMSTELMDRWRVNYICTDVGVEYPVLETDDAGGTVVARVLQNTVSALYNEVVITTPGIDLNTLGVKAGHTLRYGYTTDMYGNEIYKEIMIIRAGMTDTLLVLGDFGGEQEEQKITIFKDTRAEDVVERVGSRSAGINYRRVSNVFPPVLEDTQGQVVPGYYGAAALAGLAGGVEPHQGLTNSKILGFTNAEMAPASRLNTIMLNDLAGHGVTIIEGRQGNIGIRHELTTANIDRKNREAMITRNLDSLSYQYFDALSPFIGIANVTPEFVEKLKTEVKAMNNFIISDTKRPLIGSQMISCQIVSIAQNDVLLDKIDFYLRPELPYPFNYGDVHIQI